MASLIQTIINKNFPCKDMVVYNAGDISSKNNLHNIPGPLGSISTAQLLSPQAGYQAKPTLKNNTQAVPDYLCYKLHLVISPSIH